jgi:hypothetical protein
MYRPLFGRPALRPESPTVEEVVMMAVRDGASGQVRAKAEEMHRQALGLREAVLGKEAL